MSLQNGETPAPDAEGTGPGGGPDAGTTPPPGPCSPPPPGPGTAPPPGPGATARRRGRPRSEAVEQAIFEAVGGLLDEGVPLTELSVERIARTAGVGKATIYRRWSGKEDLFVDLLRSLEPPDPVLPGTSARDDLVALLEALRQRGLAKRSSALLHTVFSQMQLYPKLWDAYQLTVIEPRRRLGLDAVRRGMERGEIRDDLDVEFVNDLLTGPLLLRTVVRPGSTLEPGLAERVVDTVLDGLRPRT
ncbi:TetR/AcrR family transcriptional regulator [Streptomyces sp. NPDC098101]|uniref:TetR/AcrR family transcriptional regulator n=1 Tax=Streptomyces sp. NPDC098101 TaxID=3366096 RepID=UPI003806C8D4